VSLTPRKVVWNKFRTTFNIAQKFTRRQYYWWTRNIQQSEHKPVGNSSQLLQLDESSESEFWALRAWCWCFVGWIININWRDVQTKNVVNNVDMSCLRAPWQNGPYKNLHKGRWAWPCYKDRTVRSGPLALKKMNKKRLRPNTLSEANTSVKYCTNSCMMLVSRKCRLLT